MKLWKLISRPFGSVANYSQPIGGLLTGRMGDSAGRRDAIRWMSKFEMGTNRGLGALAAMIHTTIEGSHKVRSKAFHTPEAIASFPSRPEETINSTKHTYSLEFPSFNSQSLDQMRSNNRQNS